MLWTSLVAQMVKRLSTMRKTQIRSLGQEDPLEKEMAALSSTPAWKIPRMEEPGRLQSLGSLQVGHDWVTSLTHKHVVNFKVSTNGHQVIQFSDYLNEVIIIFLLL